MPMDRSEKEMLVYFVDGAKYETDQKVVTGALIKAKIPAFDPSYGLFLEAPDAGPDRMIDDDTGITVGVDEHPLRFYTVPPAVAGCA
jgi:hypothetical protein